MNNLQNATSSGGDLNVDRFFVGRKIELDRAIEAIRQHRLIIVDGYTSAGKSYFALQCLNVVGRDTTESSSEGNRHVQQGVFIDVRASSSSNDACANIILQILLGTEDFHGLIAILPNASTRRAFTTQAVEMSMSLSSKQIDTPFNLEPVIQLFEMVVSNIQLHFDRRSPLVVCIDNVSSTSLDSNFSHFLDRAAQAGVHFILTRNTTRECNTWNEFVRQHPQAEIISIGRMSFADVDALVNKIEFHLSGHYHFTHGARLLIFDLAGGLPYFVHFICHGALQIAHQRNQKTIDEDILSDVRQGIKAGERTSHFEKILQYITNSPIKKEYVLDYIAQPHSDQTFDIPFTGEKEMTKSGFLMQEGNTMFLIASPPIQVYGKLRLS